MVDDGRSVVPIRGSSCGGAHSVLVLSLVVRWCGGHSVVVVQSSPATMVAIQSSSATLVQFSLELSNHQEFHLFLHPIVMKCSSILSLLMFCKKIKFNAWRSREGYPYSSIYYFTLSRWVHY